MHSGDTIVAIGSAPGAAARAIVRLSGPDSFAIAEAMAEASGCSTAYRTRIAVAGMKVGAWVYRFQSPRSYSGEDMVELHVPGNALLARMLLQEIVARGARPAEAGEFSARAYFNGKMDLTEAEGIAATIHAHGEAELRAARQLSAGELSRRVRPAMESIAETLALVEVGIDFVEEDVTFLSADEIEERLGRVEGMLADLVGNSARFERLAHEPTFVLVGRPNAGKSTLLNALSGQARAVVSAEAGTTRDVLSAEVALASGMVRVLDAAGLEERVADDTIAAQMHARALSAVQGADVVMLVRDATDARAALEVGREADLTVVSKVDLRPDAPADSQRTVHVSAHRPQTLQKLRERMQKLAFAQIDGSTLALNARHLEAIAHCRAALQRARGLARSTSAELLAMELREGLEALGRIVGRVSPDELLGRIFGAFCIGK